MRETTVARAIVGPSGAAAQPDAAGISPMRAPGTVRTVDVVLRDGETVHVRPLLPADEAALLAFLQGLSDEARAFRFFSAATNLRRAARSAVQEAASGHGLVAVAGEPGTIVAHAMWIGVDRDTAEVAFAVADAWQKRGLATTLLLEQLAADAAERGIAAFDAVVLPDNHAMIDVFRDSGFPVDVRSEPGEIAVRLPTAITAQARRAFEDRDRPDGGRGRPPRARAAQHRAARRHEPPGRRRGGARREPPRQLFRARLRGRARRW